MNHLYAFMFDQPFKFIGLQHEIRKYFQTTTISRMLVLPQKSKMALHAYITIKERRTHKTDRKLVKIGYMNALYPFTFHQLFKQLIIVTEPKFSLRKFKI